MFCRPLIHQADIGYINKCCEAENKKNPPEEGGLKALYFSAGGGSKPLNTCYSLLRREMGKLELFLNI
jgi:hypothetical protein